jgi:hypothetical protein
MVLIIEWNCYLGGMFCFGVGAARAYSKSAHQKKDEHDDGKKSDAAAWVIAPAATMRPGRECTEKHHNQQNQYNKSKHSVL